MKKMVYGIIATVLCGIVAMELHAQDGSVDKEKMAQIDRMAQAINLEKLILDKFAESMGEGMSDAEAEGLPDDFTEVFIRQVTERFQVDEFVEEVIAPVLDEHFSLEDMKLVADFLDSDFGKELIAAKLNDEEYDVQSKLRSGDVEEADAVKAMQLFVRFGSRQDDLANIGSEIEERAQIYGERIAMEVVSDMMDDYMEEAAE